MTGYGANQIHAHPGIECVVDFKTNDPPRAAAMDHQGTRSICEQ